MVRQLFVITCLLFFHLVSSGQTIYTEKGKASFYAHKFDGRKTASGEIFSNKKLTAAHLKLPFGTLVRVTNLKNQKSIIVRINDRGPYIKGRIIDLTKAAADSLDFIHSGWAEVLVEEVAEEIEVPVLQDRYKILFDSLAFRFPRDWLGRWEGDLRVYNTEGLIEILPMQLIIEATEDIQRYRWQIVYREVPRNYELVIHDSLQRVFSIDEKNGIDIMSYLFGNRLISRFDVEGHLIESEYTLVNRNLMNFEIRSGISGKNFTTGKIDTVEVPVPEVGVYSLRIIQVATLTRITD